MRHKSRAIALVVSIAAMAMALYQLLYTQILLQSPDGHMITHLGLALFIIFLSLMLKAKDRKEWWMGCVLLLVAMAVTLYLMIELDEILEFRTSIPAKTDLVAGVLIILVTLSALPLANIVLFLIFRKMGGANYISIPAAFMLAAVMNYLLCINFLFRHKAKWKTAGEMLVYILVVCLVGAIDFAATTILLEMGAVPLLAKSSACIAGLLFNFLGRRYFVFPEPPPGPWQTQVSDTQP